MLLTASGKDDESAVDEDLAALLSKIQGQLQTTEVELERARNERSAGTATTTSAPVRKKGKRETPVQTVESR